MKARRTKYEMKQLASPAGGMLAIFRGPEKNGKYEVVAAGVVILALCKVRTGRATSDRVCGLVSEDELGLILCEEQPSFVGYLLDDEGMEQGWGGVQWVPGDLIKEPTF